MNHSNQVLNDLVSATRDGKSFYENAAAEVTDSKLKTLFTRLAKVKGEIAVGLSTEIWAAGETPAVSGTWSGDFTKLYAKVRATLSDKNFAYVAELEDSEDQLL
ncbi:MAG: PA2169 family four-helix-bundle protein, partial [Lysobacteraceae bacterium]